MTQSKYLTAVDASEPKYLTAAEARERASSARSLTGNYLRAETDAIIARIAAESDKGINQINISGADLTILDRLEKLGYQVNTTYDQRDGNWTVVSW